MVLDYLMIDKRPFTVPAFYVCRIGHYLYFSKASGIVKLIVCLILTEVHKLILTTNRVWFSSMSVLNVKEGHIIQW